jgi:hypothetical protein
MAPPNYTRRAATHNGLNEFGRSRGIFYRLSRKEPAPVPVHTPGESASGNALGANTNAACLAGKRSEPMLKKIILAAALASGAAVAAVPAVAQTADEGVMIDRVVNPDGSMVITRRFTAANGETVDVTRTYLIGYAAVPSGQSPMFNSQANTVSGGVGGAIGGDYILGTTPADNKPLPPEWSRLPYSFVWPAPVVTVREPAPIVP